jgi:hypothetical protein
MVTEETGFHERISSISFVKWEIYGAFVNGYQEGFQTTWPILFNGHQDLVFHKQ